MDFKSLMPFGASRTPASAPASDPFQAMRREMERIFDTFTQGSPWPVGLGGSGFLSPKINVAETDKGLEVSADLPGIDEKDIEVQLDQGILSLKAEHKSEKEEADEKKHYHLVERSYGTFLRRIAVPFEADADKVEATFEKGVLKIVVPRSAAAGKQVRKIAIKAA
jgi:HSP20 family protein